MLIILQLCDLAAEDRSFSELTASEFERNADYVLGVDAR